MLYSASSSILSMLNRAICSEHSIDIPVHASLQVWPVAARKNCPAGDRSSWVTVQ